MGPVAAAAAAAAGRPAGLGAAAGSGAPPAWRAGAHGRKGRGGRQGRAGSGDSPGIAAAAAAAELPTRGGRGRTDAPLPLSPGGPGAGGREKAHNGAFHRQPVAGRQDGLRGGPRAGLGLPCTLFPSPPAGLAPGRRRPRLPLPLLLGPCFLFALRGSRCHGRGRGGDRLFGQGPGG